MIEKGKVSNRQGIFLLAFTVVVSTAVLFAPAITAAKVGRDGWISILFFPTIFGILVSWIIVKLAQRFPQKTIVEYAPIILGPFLGKIVGAAYIFWFLHINSIVLREFGDFLITCFMPETPLAVFLLVLLILGAWAARSGLEVICRVNEFIFPFYILSVTLIFLIALLEADFSNLLPVMENGFLHTFKGAWVPAAWRGEIIYAAMILPYVRGSDKSGRFMALAVVLIGIVLTFTTIISTLVLGELSRYLAFPLFELARIISIGRFFERMEVLVLIMWVAGVTIKVSLFYYLTALGTAQLFELSDYRPLLFSIGLLMGVWSIVLFENSGELIEWLAKVAPVHSYIYEIGLPLLMLTVAAVRKKGGHLRDE